MGGSQRAGGASAPPSVFTLHSCGSAGRRLSRTIGKLPAARVARAGDQWEAATTHVVTPAFSRSIKIVCALATGARIVRPAFVDHCVQLGHVPPVPPPHLEWGADHAPSDDPRIRRDAAALWRARRADGLGGPLQDVKVHIVGELAPRARGGAGVISTNMAQQILAAAGADVVSSVEQASFALVTDAVAQMPVVATLKSKGVVCFGPAILVDLVARVEIAPAEFLAFRDQAHLAAPPFKAQVVTSARFVPLVAAQLAAPSTAPPVTPSEGDIAAVAVVQRESISRSAPRSRRRREQKHDSVEAPASSVTLGMGEATPRRPRRSSTRTRQANQAVRAEGSPVAEKKPISWSGGASSRTEESIALRLPVSRLRSKASSSDQMTQPGRATQVTSPASSSKTLRNGRVTKARKPTNVNKNTKASKSANAVNGAKVATTPLCQLQLPPTAEAVPAVPAESGNVSVAPSVDAEVAKPGQSRSHNATNSVDAREVSAVFLTPAKTVRDVKALELEIPKLEQTVTMSAQKTSQTLGNTSGARRNGNTAGPVVPQLDDSAGAMLLLALAGGRGEGMEILVKSPKSPTSGEKRKRSPDDNDVTGGSLLREEGSPEPEKRRRTLEPMDERREQPKLASNVQSPLGKDFQEAAESTRDAIPQASLQEKKDAPPESPCRRQNASDTQVGAVPRADGAIGNEVEDGTMDLKMRTNGEGACGGENSGTGVMPKACTMFRDDADARSGSLAEGGRTRSTLDKTNVGLQVLTQRKRPRRIVRESPPSDSEEEEGGAEASQSAIAPDACTPVQTRIPMHDVSADEEDADGLSLDMPKPLSFGVPSSSDRGQIKESIGTGAQPRRRRIQLRTPDAPVHLRSASARRRFHSECDSSVRDGLGSNAFPVDSSADSFISGLSFDEAHDSVFKLIGPIATPEDVKKLFPQAIDVSPVDNNESHRPERRGQQGSSGKGSGPMFDDSPHDFCEDDLNSQPGAELHTRMDLDCNEQMSKSFMNRARDGHSSARPGQTLNSERRDGTSYAPVLDLPTVISTPPQVIPRYLYALTSRPSVVDVKVGSDEDDSFVQDSIAYYDWLYGAELLELGKLSRERLLQDWQSPKGFDAKLRLKYLRDSTLLRHFVSLSDFRPDRVGTLLGICSRLLYLELGDNVLSVFLGLLLQTRDDQLEKGRDSLRYLLSNSGRNAKGLHGHLQFIWVCFLDACRTQDQDGKLSNFWRLFNEHWFAGQELSENKQDSVTAYASRDEKTGKLLDTLVTLGGLFAFQLTEPVEKTPVSLAPNWVAVQIVLDAIVDRKYPNVGEHRQVLSRLLRRICTDFADRLWKVEECFVLKALDAVKSICVKFDASCSCTSIPMFLSQFKSISDLRSRRRSLPDYIRTECDCVMFLSWVLIAQASNVSSKLSAKIVRHSALFVKSKGSSKDPAKALTHHLGLTLSVADSIVRNGSGREELLRAMLFSKAPDISKAAKDPFSFGPSAFDSWTAVVETIQLRCRTLLASGNSIHVYSDYICSNVAAALHCIEKPDTGFAGNIEKREAWRVQQRVFVDLVVKLLSAFVEVLGHLTQNINQGSYSNHEAVDSLLISLSRFVGGLGKFATGLVAQIRNNPSGTTSSGRHAILNSIVSFVEQGLDLCTVHSHGRMRREGRGIVLETQSSQPSAAQVSGLMSGIDSFATNVKKCMLTAFISMTQRSVSKTESKSDLELRIVASKALARTLGLCCIGPSPDYTRHTASSLLQVIQDANMTVLELGGGHRGPFLSQAPLNGQAQRDAKETELLIQTEFWCVLLDSTWSRSLLQISERLEEIVFGIWVIVLVVTYSEKSESPLLKALPALSYGVQCAASTSSNIGKWFYATQYGKKCREALSSVPGERMSVSELDAQGRLETLVDCLSAILRSWVSTKVLSLLTFLRMYVTSDGVTKARTFDQASSQPFFRPTRDLEDAEQFLLHTQVLSVLFVIHASLSLPSSQYRGGRVGNEKSVSKLFLNDISESLLKALNKFRKGRSSSQGTALEQIQVLVIAGLATVGYNPRDMETRISFLRFIRLCGNAGNLSGLFTWNDETCLPEFLKREPFMFKSVATDYSSVARRRTVEKSGREWRLLAFHTLVEDPITRLPISSQEFRNALRYMLDLLQPAQSANIRDTGLWATLCSSIKHIGVRRQSSNFSTCGEIVPRLLERMWCNIRFQIPEQDMAIIRTALLGTGG